MSVYSTRFDITETQLDDEDLPVKEFKKDLPHHEFICSEMCKSWNEMHMERFYDGILKGKIEEAHMMYGQQADGTSYGMIRFKGVPGFRMTQKIKDEINEQTSSQFCDGWGEGFFGYINIMTAPDGTRLIVE